MYVASANDTATFMRARQSLGAARRHWQVGDAEDGEAEKGVGEVPRNREKKCRTRRYLMGVGREVCRALRLPPGPSGPSGFP